MSSDGREIYFDVNSVLNVPFDELSAVMEARFDEEQARQGAQAGTVRVVGKQHVVH